MVFKTVLALSLLIVLIQSSPLQSRSSVPLELVSIITLEEPCVRQGGQCLRIEDCNPENLVQLKGILCPMQRHLGVECCYRLGDEQIVCVVNVSVAPKHTHNEGPCCYQSY